MTNESDAIRLRQGDNLKALFQKISIMEMVTVYYTSESSNHGVYCGLIPNSEVKKSLKSFSWDLSHGGGYPDATVYYNDGDEVAIYHRYGNDQGVEPLIIDRDFGGIRPDYVEINEEFRFFHQLYHDVKENKYIKINDSGLEEVVAVVESGRVKIRLKEIRQFLSIKEMHLAIQFDYRELSAMKLGQLGLSSDDNKEEYADLACWSLHFGDVPGCNSQGFSRLLGKYLIPPFPKTKSGMWGFTQEKPEQYADFVIGVDDDGENIMYSSNPDLLANSFGANPDAPNYLTAVCFRKDVLDKYYKKSSMFSVEDNYLRCGSLWWVQIDNHHSDKVCVWLGDLGRDLPYEEQLHWKSYNIAPVGKVSDVFFKRQILAQFTDSDQLDHIFKTRYNSLIKTCSEILTWQILLPLGQDDEHHLSSIRRLATEEQSDFDEQILSITKILVDSLNEKKLNTLIPSGELSTINGSINRLEKVFGSSGFDGYQQHIEFVRRLQNLRSSGAAHRKGNNYKKVSKDFGMASNSLLNVLDEILRKANEFLAFLESSVKKGVFSSGEIKNV